MNDIEPTCDFFPGVFQFKVPPFDVRLGYTGANKDKFVVHSAYAFGIFLSKCSGDLINSMEWSAHVVSEVKPVEYFKGVFRILDVGGEKVIGGEPVPSPPVSIPTKKQKFNPDVAWGCLTKARTSLVHFNE